RESAAEGQELGERSVHGNRSERSRDDRPGPSRHATLRDDVWKCCASVWTLLASRRHTQLGYDPPHGLGSFLRSWARLAGSGLHLFSVFCFENYFVSAVSIKPSERCPSGHYA